MRLFRQLTFAAAFLVADAAFAGQGRISVEVQTGSWGDASVSDIRSVLQSVVDVLAPHLPKQAGRIIVAYSPIGPRVLPRKSADDPHLVFLKVQDRRWNQFAYQFSHEFCHIFSNHDRRPMGAAYGSREHQWFEETLCEVVSLVTLNRLAASWRESPPRAGWQEYAPAFSEYSARLLSREHRRMPADGSPREWYLRHQAMLDKNPYSRRANEQLAASLLQVFDSTPGSLAAIAYLNIDVPPEQSFAAYLAAWRDCCPPEHRAFVNRLIALFPSV